MKCQAVPATKCGFKDGTRSSKNDAIPSTQTHGAAGGAGCHGVAIASLVLWLAINITDQVPQMRMALGAHELGEGAVGHLKSSVPFNRSKYSLLTVPIFCILHPSKISFSVDGDVTKI